MRDRFTILFDRLDRTISRLDRSADRLDDLAAELADFRADMRGEFRALRSGIRDGFGPRRPEIAANRGEIAGYQRQLRLIGWTIAGILLAQLAAGVVAAVIALSS